MDRVLFCVVAYGALLAFGIRAIRRQGGRAGESALFVALIGWCAYMSAAKFWQLPSGSVIKLHSWTFSTLGKWIADLFGGSPV